METQISTTEIRRPSLSISKTSSDFLDWRNPFLVKEGNEKWKVMNSFFGEVILENVECFLGEEPKGCCWNNYGSMAIYTTANITYGPEYNISNNGRILFTVNYGKTWRLLEIPKVQGQHNNVMIFSQDGKYIVKNGTNMNQDGFYWYSSDYGNTFKQMPSTLFHQGTWGGASCSMSSDGQYFVGGCRSDKGIVSSDYFRTLSNSTGYTTGNQSISKTVRGSGSGIISTTVDIDSHYSNVYENGVGKKRINGVALLPIDGSYLVGVKTNGEIVIYKDYNDTTPESINATEYTPFYLVNQYQYSRMTKARFISYNDITSYRIWIHNDGVNEIEFDVKLSTAGGTPKLKLGALKKYTENTSREPTYRMMVDKGILIGKVSGYGSEYNGSLDVSGSSIQDARVESRVCRFGNSTSSPLRLYFRDNYGLGNEQYMELPSGNKYIFPRHQFC